MIDLHMWTLHSHTGIDYQLLSKTRFGRLHTGAPSGVEAVSRCVEAPRVHPDCWNEATAAHAAAGPLAPPAPPAPPAVGAIICLQGTV